MPLDHNTRLQKHCRTLATRFNNKFWAGKLPRVPWVVRPGKLGCNSWGETAWDSEGNPVEVRIGEANWGLDSKNSFLKATVLHELLHIALGSTVGHDSPEWKAEALRISRLGAFLETV